jgi:lambda family phage portal protein
MAYPSLKSRGFLLPSRLRAKADAYEAGSSGGSRSINWLPSNAGPNVSGATLPLIRRRSRDAIRNDPWAKAAIARLVSNTIGTGIQPYPLHPDKAVCTQLKELWSDWVPDADADGRLDAYGMQAMAARAMFGDGEGLARIRPRRLEDGLAVPIQLQALEADHLPVEKTESLANGNEIIQGVEFDALGRRAAYHLWRRHPGDYVGGGAPQALTRVPAQQILHVYQANRPGQVRGMPELTAVLLRLKSLDNFNDAVLFRQEVANLFAGFITRPEPEQDGRDPMTGDVSDLAADGFASIASLEPGVMNVLGVGESVEWSDPPDAGNNYDGFMRNQLMASCASVGVPYEVLTGDLRGVSDRVLRVILNEFHRQIEQLQWLTFINQYCRPVWAAWVDAVALAGILPMPDFYRNRRAYLRVKWVPQGWAYVHPVQDMDAQERAVRAGFRSRSSVILSQGDDPDLVAAEISADNEQADENGFVFASDPRRTSTTGVAMKLQPNDTE